MSQAVSTVQFDTEAAKRQVIYYATKYRAVIFAVAMVVLFLAISQIADAGTTQDEFSASAGKFEGWIKGNLGKAISFVALIIGAFLSRLCGGEYFLRQLPSFKTFLSRLCGGEYIRTITCHC